MLDSLKHAVKQVLIQRRHQLYRQQVAAGYLNYDKWIRELERKDEIAGIYGEDEENRRSNERKNTGNDGRKKKNDGELAKKTIFVPTWKKTVKEVTEYENVEAHYIIFFMYEGKSSESSLGLITEKFEENKNIILIYGDEDTITEDGKRIDPWFKPDWSPDTFLSGFYFGGLVAVRGKAFMDAYRGLAQEGLLEGLTQHEALYAIFYEMIRTNGGFSMRQAEKTEPVRHLSSVLYHNQKNGYEKLRDLKLKRIRRIKETDREKKPDLSVIIPSKDNPDVLFLCIESLVKKTKTDCAYELLIIDNGSLDENKIRIEKEIQKLEKEQGQTGFFGIRYLYRPMPFNFSKMCNLGAEEAAGDVLLFLNDDMEIISADWMDLLMEKACLPYVGAVGAKLLYPGTDIIQHAGITNLRVGPAHKLQYLSDAEEYYFGKNRGVHNMLAVTGACLMVRRKVFVQAGGFAKELAVAFNDVDLCYTIHELGYYNVQRNDVTLYHHESLSRGKDGESTEKQLRLQREKDLLYERHQDIYGKDPYYHKNLTTDMLESEYAPAFHYQVKLDMPWAKVKPCTALVQNAAEDKCLVVGMECAMDLYKWQYGVSADKGKIKPKAEDMGYYFQGYSFVIGADNACYEKKLLLKNTENAEVFAVSLEKCCRQDIKKNLKDQVNVDLTGYVAKVQKNVLPDGIYRFGMLAQDMCSRQKLVNWSNWVLEILPDKMSDGKEETHAE